MQGPGAQKQVTLRHVCVFGVFVWGFFFRLNLIQIS